MLGLFNFHCASAACVCAKVVSLRRRRDNRKTCLHSPHSEQILRVMPTIPPVVPTVPPALAGGGIPDAELGAPAAPNGALEPAADGPTRRGLLTGAAVVPAGLGAPLPPVGHLQPGGPGTHQRTPWTPRQQLRRQRVRHQPTAHGEHLGQVCFQSSVCSLTSRVVEKKGNSFREQTDSHNRHWGLLKYISLKFT